MLLYIAVILAVAAFAGCGDDEDTEGDVSGVEAVSAETCGALEYEGEGPAEVVITSDLPMQGDSRERSEQQVDAIRLALDQNDWKAGDVGVAFQACDDSIAKTGEWDPKVCRDNAKAYADDSDVVGVIGTYNSGCAVEMVPILSQARGGGLAMVSPGNTLVCLTQPQDEGCEAGQPDSLYEGGTRTYARVVPNDAAQGAALVQFADDEGIAEPFILYADEDPQAIGLARNYEGAAEDLGLEIAGFEAWDPEGKDFTKLMDEVKRSGADAVLLAGILEYNGAQLIKDKVATLGPNDGDVKLLAADGFYQQSTIDEAGEASAGMFIGIPGLDPERLDEAGTEFAQELEEEYDASPVEFFAPYAGAATEVILKAIEEGGAKRGAVAEALFGLEIEDGIVGTFTIEGSGDPSIRPITISVAEDSLEPVTEIDPPTRLVDAARGE